MALYTVKPPGFAIAGSKIPRIVLLGEAWGESEDRTHRPFAGQSGQELFRMLGEAMPDIEPELHLAVQSMMRYGDAWVADRQAWLESAGIAMTNVFNFRPPGNKLEDLCKPKKEVSEYAGTFAPLARGKYLPEDFLPELDRLQHELEHWRPNLVVCLGNTACWAMLQATNIGSIRGAITSSDGCGTRGSSALVEGGRTSVARAAFKVLPTYHPAGVLRSWAWRPIVVADLMKAARESQYPDIRRPARRVLVQPTLAEMLAWEAETYKRPGLELSADIETEAGQITMIGFGRSPVEAMVIPFWDRTRPGYNYWSDAAQERQAWDCVERLLTHDCRKIGQNFIYDLQYITKYGIRPTRCTADTMLLHHSLFPEMQKGLAFLGSIYTNEISWKLWRKRKADSVKADE